MNGEAISLEQQRELVAKAKAKVRPLRAVLAVPLLIAERAQLSSALLCPSHSLCSPQGVAVCTPEHVTAVLPPRTCTEPHHSAQTLTRTLCHAGSADASCHNLTLILILTLTLTHLPQVDAAASALDRAQAPRAAIRTAALGCDRDGAAYWHLHSARVLTGEKP